MSDLKVDIPDAVFESAKAGKPIASTEGGVKNAPDAVKKSMMGELLDSIPDPKEKQNKNDKPNLSREKAKEPQARGAQEEKPETVLRKAERETEGDAEGTRKADPIPRVIKLKAAGKEVDFDLSDEARTKSMLEKALGADEIFEHSAKMRKQADNLFNLLKSARKDPSILEDVFANEAIGIDFKEIAKDYVYQLIQEEEAEANLTDEQKEWRKAYKERQKAERAQARQKELEEEERSQAEKQRSQEVWEQDYEQKIIEALQVKGIPQTHKTVEQMAWYIEKALENNRDVTPHEIADYILEQQTRYYRTNVDEMDEDSLAAFLGDKNLAKLRQYEIKRLKSPTQAQFERPKPENNPQTKREAPQKKRALEWTEDLKQGFLAQFS